ncbi:TetR/AcrR family transcriptional regulator [Maritalea sp.]|uniref:TetR/AcrR family transcriptional regulator n=1 Tax=Maritalea sp. TaxID=2003361 RepID=UPI003EF41ADB
MAKHFSTQEKKKITAQLCEVGHEEFTQRGLRAARVEDICRSVGISKGAFYSFFPSKEELFLAIMMRREVVHHAAVEKLLNNHDGTERELIIQLFDALLAAIKTDPFLAIMMRPGELELLARKLGPEQMAQHQENDMVFFAQVTKKLQAMGYSTNTKPTTFGEISTLLFCTLMQANLLTPDLLDAAIAQLRDLFLFKLTSPGKL